MKPNSENWRRLNYVRYEKHCPTFPPMSIKILQSILREELVVCVKHANFIENLLLSSFHIQCKNETLRSFVYMHSQLERRGKEGKKQTNRKTWSMQRLQNLFLCVFHSNIISHFPSFLTLSNNWVRYEKMSSSNSISKENFFWCPFHYIWEKENTGIIQMCWRKIRLKIIFERPRVVVACCY